MPSDHAIFSPSSAERWLSCTGSVRMSALFEKEDDTEYSHVGTVCHDIAERCLQLGREPNTYLGKTINGVELDMTWIKVIKTYCDYVRSFQNKNTISYYEKRVKFDQFAPDGFGTVDCIIYDGDKAHIIDLKTGSGVKVSAENNTQLKLYALGVYQSYDIFDDIKSYTLHVVQPPMKNISSFEISKEDLLEFGVHVKHKCHEALSENIEFKPSEKACQWCVCKAKCKALYDHTVAEIENKLEANMLDNDSLIHVLDRQDLFDRYVKSVHKTALTVLKKGEKLNGWKTVESRTQRKWKPEALEILERRYGEQAYVKKIINVTKADQLFGKDVTKNLTMKAKGALKIAKDTDVRDELTIQKQLQEEF